MNTAVSSIHNEPDIIISNQGDWGSLDTIVPSEGSTVGAVQDGSKIIADMIDGLGFPEWLKYPRQ